MISTFIKRRPRTFWYAIVGLVAGLLIGGVGVALRGFAFSLHPELVLAMAGAIIGYRADNKRERAAHNKKCR
ncbi:MAG TPA: hypothetical protein VMT72_21685 [Pseudolabrys sp.]|nr:hypothetical protein [Pseudolabrys sp.]